MAKFRFLDDYYLMALDGTEYFSSHEVHCCGCLEKHHRNGKVTYHHQMLGAVIICPGRKEVIPLMPEPILRQDGETKNDCERNALKRFLPKFRQDHPHLRVIATLDALYANAPVIRDLRTSLIPWIIRVKSDGHASHLRSGAFDPQAAAEGSVGFIAVRHLLLNHAGMPSRLPRRRLTPKVCPDHWPARLFSYLRRRNPPHRPSFPIFRHLHPTPPVLSLPKTPFIVPSNPRSGNR